MITYEDALKRLTAITDSQSLSHLRTEAITWLGYADEALKRDDPTTAVVCIHYVIRLFR